MSYATRRSAPHESRLHPEICERALNARDPRFDGLFFVGITTTGIYCRSICPARVSYTDRRRFFDSAAGAERAGFRPCLRCRPELAPGRALCDAVSRLARAAAQRIEAGALNGHNVADLARDLGVSERHLRRALERELGVSPLELAQTHRLLLAKRLLADTSLPVTRIAFASGFQSLRRFNSAFLEGYGLNPGAFRRAPRVRKTPATPASPLDADMLHLTLAYRPPLAWSAFTDALAREALPGAELIHDGHYLRTVSMGGRAGVVTAEDAASRDGDARRPRSHLLLGIASSLVEVVMPVLAQLRHFFDLDAEPAVVDAHLATGGLGRLVKRRPGLRIPGAMDGFEAALRPLLHGPESRSNAAANVIDSLGAAAETGIPELTRHLPTPARVAAAGVDTLVHLGLARLNAELLVAIARRMADSTLRLEPGCDAAVARRTLLSIEGMDDRLATDIVMRALDWPDAFLASDPVLLRVAGVSSVRSLEEQAEKWRPWRAYAALHLRLADLDERLKSQIPHPSLTAESQPIPEPQLT